MKKSLIALAALATVAAAYADGSSVQLYGIVDAAVGHVQHSLSVDAQFPGSVNPFTKVATSVPAGVTGMFNGGESPGRWGIKGTEDLGNGMKAVFVLESGFNLPTGQISNAAGALAANSPTATTANNSATSSVDGQLFNRQAWVALSDNNLGQVALGRNYAPIFDVTIPNDPLSGAQLFSPLGFSGTIGGGGGVSEDTRVDNSIKYTNKTGDFNYGALYKFGGVAGNSSAGSATAFNIGYMSGPLSIQAAHQEFRDGVKGVPGTLANEVKVSVYNTKATMVAATYALSSANIKAGYEEYTLSTPSDAASLFNSYYGQTVQAATAGLSATQAARTTDVIWVGGDYNVTPMFNVAAGYYDQKQKASADNGQTAGDIFTYSLLASYRFTKMTDVYAGAAYSQYKGTAYASGVYTSNSIVGAGLRVKF